MRRWFLWMSLSVSACAGAQPYPVTSLAPSVVVAVPNFDEDGPPCIVKLPVTAYVCSAKGCSVPTKKGSTLETIELDFSCLPKRSPTGFDRPADNAKVLSLHARNSSGHISLIEDVEGEPETRMRYLDFCLYGIKTNFCGGGRRCFALKTATRLIQLPQSSHSLRESNCRTHCGQI